MPPGPRRRCAAAYMVQLSFRQNPKALADAAVPWVGSTSISVEAIVERCGDGGGVLASCAPADRKMAKLRNLCAL